MSEASLFTRISKSLGSVDWSHDFQVYLEPFKKNWVNIVLCCILWFAVHFISDIVANKTGAVKRVIANMKEADKTKNRIRTEKQYYGRATFDINTKVTATVHALFASIASIYALATYSTSMMNATDIYSNEPFWTTICTISAGYFFYDFVVAVWDMDPQYLIHGSFSFSIYGHASYPFLAHVGGLYLCYEISAFFLHMRWFMIQAGLGQGGLFTIVENCFAGFFLLIRIGWGNWFGTFHMHPVLWKLFFLGEPNSPHSRIAAGLFSLANIAIQILNTYWASMIVNVIRRSLVRNSKPKVQKLKDNDDTQSIEKKVNIKTKTKSKSA